MFVVGKPRLVDHSPAGGLSWIRTRLVTAAQGRLRLFELDPPKDEQPLGGVREGSTPLAKGVALGREFVFFFTKSWEWSS